MAPTNDVLAALSPYHIDFDIQVILVVRVEAYLVLVCNKTNYHPAFSAL